MKYILTAITILLLSCGEKKPDPNQPPKALKSEKLYCTLEHVKDDIIKVTYHNELGKDIYLLKRSSPFDEKASDTFKIVKFGDGDSKFVKYIGGNPNLSEPAFKDYIKIPKGEKVETEVKLANFYQLEKGSEYFIKFYDIVGDHVYEAFEGKKKITDFHNAVISGKAIRIKY